MQPPDPLFSAALLSMCITFHGWAPKRDSRFWYMTHWLRQFYNIDKITVWFIFFSTEFCDRLNLRFGTVILCLMLKFQDWKFMLKIVMVVCWFWIMKHLASNVLLCYWLYQFRSNNSRQWLPRPGALPSTWHLNLPSVSDFLPMVIKLVCLGQNIYSLDKNELFEILGKKRIPREMKELKT